MPLTTGSRIPPIPADAGDLIAAINDRLRRIVQHLAADLTGKDKQENVSGELMLTAPGTLGIRSNAAPLVSLPAVVTPVEIMALVKRAPSGAALTMILNAAGSSYATLTIAAGATSASSSGTLAPIPANSLLTLDLTGVGSTFPGSDLSVLIRF